MRGEGKYRTRQGEVILDFFQGHPNTHFTALEVYMRCREGGHRIGEATVYRQIQRLVDEGVLHKYQINRSSSACFEFVSENPDEKESLFVHCKCEKCGRLFHLEGSCLTAVGTSLQESYGFRLKPEKTVFYGVCADCLESDC